MVISAWDPSARVRFYELSFYSCHKANVSQTVFMKVKKVQSTFYYLVLLNCAFLYNINLIEDLISQDRIQCSVSPILPF